ncbi:CPBP family intramembrane metalloprotease [Dorea formicigenerans]|uniref:CPBP family intramembrane metalloprotease n=2 Tax=Dorea formicigenerans TaxID=39486 RepID=A0A413SEH5_9FIRM|nr:CPBP family intramembrane metalloprotease [Dorea formicigenerans]
MLLLKEENIMKNFKYKESPIFRFLLFLYSFELFFFIIVYLYVHITNRTYIPSNYILVMLLPALSALFATNSVFPYNKANTFFTFFTFYFILIFLYTIFSLFFPYNNKLIFKTLVVLGSLISLYILFTLPDKNRKHTGLTDDISIREILKYTICFIFLFSLMVRLEFFCDYFATHDLTQLTIPLANWNRLPELILTFLLTYILYWGEEYGWGYYLFPLLTQKYGIYKSIIFLGIIKIFFHLPLDYYLNPNTIPFALFFTRSLIIFSSNIYDCWIYKRTSTIWIAVILHYFNNNLLDLWQLTDKSLSFSTPLAAFCYTVIFGSFIFSKTFRE